jgi:TetR/AcrR family transcriptional regulator, biofilm operon repressor
MTKKIQVKDNIGKAAMQCFARFGLEKTTLDDIARSVGLNKASLYYYYRNKEDIFLEAAVKEGEHFIQQLEARTLQKKGTQNRVLFYLQERIQYYMHVLNMNNISVETLNKLLPRFFELYEHVTRQEIQFVTGLLQAGIREGELEKTDAVRLASSLITVSDAVKHNTEQKALLQGQPAADYSNALQELKFIVTLMFKGLTPK